MLSSLVWEIVTGDTRSYHHNPFACEVNICLTHKSRNQDDSVQLEFLTVLGFFPPKKVLLLLYSISPVGLFSIALSSFLPPLEGTSVAEQSRKGKAFEGIRLAWVSSSSLGAQYSSFYFICSYSKALLVYTFKFISE